jgi:hypothetical protein
VFICVTGLIQNSPPRELHLSARRRWHGPRRLAGRRPRTLSHRYVLTKGLQAEIRAGRALWGGLMTPAAPPAELAGPDQDPEGYKALPGINIVRHSHRFLALAEGTAPYEMTPGLATVGRYGFAAGLPLGMCAHPKIDPVSGEMILFRYGLEEPYLYWATVGADGNVTRPPEIIAEIDRGYMIKVQMRHPKDLRCYNRADPKHCPDIGFGGSERSARRFQGPDRLPTADSPLQLRHRNSAVGLDRNAPFGRDHHPQL